jgi:hypothetical protein
MASSLVKNLILLAGAKRRVVEPRGKAFPLPFIKNFVSAFYEAYFVGNSAAFTLY